MRAAEMHQVCIGRGDGIMSVCMLYPGPASSNGNNDRLPEACFVADQPMHIVEFVIILRRIASPGSVSCCSEQRAGV